MASEIRQFENANNVNINNSIFNNTSYHNHVNHINIFARSDEIMRRLRPPHYIKDPFVEHKQARLDRTCQWSIEHPSVKHWINAKEPSCNRLWLCGGPGTGKSVLAAFLIEHIREHHNVGNEITLYHFSKDNEDKPVHILMDFIRQILLREDRPFHDKMDFFVKWVTDERHDYQFTLEEMAPFFCDFLGMFQERWLIMDGLDECQESSALLRVFAKVQNAKILVLSRKERHIEAELQDWPKLEIGSESESTTDCDLKSFVHNQVDSLIQDFGTLDAESERLKENLLSRSGHMFLYARFKCETIRNSRPSTKDQVEKIITGLEATPSSLAAVYNKYLTQRLSNNLPYENEIALRTLQWVIYSPQPVTLNLLRQILAIDITQDEGISPDHVAHDIKSVISNAVGILLEWRLGDLEYYSRTYFASLVHHSVREYLVGLTSDATPEQWRELLIPYKSLLPSPSNSSILTACLRVTRGTKVWDILQAYHDSADQRRKVCPTSRKRLGRQLCLNQPWDSWEAKQRHRLVKDRDWRKAEEERLRVELEEITPDLIELEWVQNSIQRLNLIREAEDQHSKYWEHQTLTSVMAMRERDPMVYAFAHVGNHFSEAKALRDEFLTTNIFQLTWRWRGYAFKILTQMARRQRNDVYTRDIITALESFSNVLAFIEELSRSLPFNRRPYWPPNLWLDPGSRLALASDAPSSRVWNAEITNSLEQQIQNLPSHLRFLFSCVTNLVVSLDNIEVAVFNYDAEAEPLVGAGILLHSVRFCKQTLAQWIVAQSLEDLKLDPQIVKNDHYLFPKLLDNPPAVGARPPIFANQPVFSHPGFVPTLVACCLLAYYDIRLLQLVVICAHLAQLQMKRYSFHPPSRLSFYFRAIEYCLPLPLLAQFFSLPLYARLVAVLLILILIWTYGYDLETIVRRSLYSMHPTDPRLGVATHWLFRNPDLSFCIYSNLAACAPVTQLNVFIIYLVFRQAIHATIDPLQLNYVRALYHAFDIEDSAVALTKITL